MSTSRIFYAAQGVLIKERNTNSGSDAATVGTYLNGVTSVGINATLPSRSLLDVGRFQRRFHYYSPQEFEVTIERVLDKTSDFFYHVDPSDYTSGKEGYKTSHILAPDNIGCQGAIATATAKALKNYDITVLYGDDSVDLIKDNTSDLKYVTYRNCLITNISYNISSNGAIGVTESITLITKVADYDSDGANEFTNLPSSAESGDIIKRSDFDLLSSSTNSILPKEVSNNESDFGNGMFDLNPTLYGLESKKILGINNISINASINYSELTDVGKRRGSAETGSSSATNQGEQNLWRYVTLPIQVTCSFTGTARQPFPADMPNTDTTFSAADGDTASEEWYKVNRPIRLVAEKFPSPPTPTYFVWDLGNHNYLTDISYAGGDTSGGNLEVTMSYQNDRSDIVLVKDTTIRDLHTGRDFIY
tara:strand:+ start:330 stop:1589 length:1260 start_codon:yes stop_codon:yes gene_type:complete